MIGKSKKNLNRQKWQKLKNKVLMSKVSTSNQLKKLKKFQKEGGAPGAQHVRFVEVLLNMVKYAAVVNSNQRMIHMI